jgi:NADH-quinone oxidoreductase subunit J
MNLATYTACGLALICAVLTITQRNAIHALVYLIMMLLSLAVIFFTLGAPFLAILEVAIYAGAIMVLFVFVVMMLNLGHRAERQEKRWLGGGLWAVPVILAAALLGLGAYALAQAGRMFPPVAMVGPKVVGLALYRPYLIAVEVASMLLLAGLIGAFHLAPPTREVEPPEEPAASPRSQIEEASHVSRG